jgi:hypothetical protein
MRPSLFLSSFFFKPVSRMDETLTIDELIIRLKSPDDKVRSAAWSAAGPLGAAAVGPVAALAADPAGELEIGRSAKRALWKIVRHAGRPGSDASARQAVADKLLSLLADDRPVQFRRDVLWMVSEIGGDACVEPVAKQLQQKDLAEDARCCLQRIPGDKSLAALRSGLAAAHGDLKSAIAESLRARGVTVPDVPSQRLVPTKATSVKPVGR